MMEQWEQWFKGFMKNWFDALAKSLSKLEPSRMKQFETAFVNFDRTEIEGFAEAWRNLSNPEEVKGQIVRSLDAIKEPSKEQMDFLRDWLAILMATIEEQEEKVRVELLSTCGAACASHATDSFKAVWGKSEGVKDFLQKMNAEVFNGENFLRYVDETTIEVVYPKCLCPIVGFNLISSPMLCNCSSAWLKTNFEAALEKTTKIQRINTVLDGERSCSFRIELS